MIREYWKWILWAGMMLIIVPSFIYRQMTLDEDLSDVKKWAAIRDALKKEYKELELPPTTAVNSFEDLSELRSDIGMSTRYRTEINNPEFVALMTKALEKRGWIYYEKSGTGESKYCRGKFDATLYYQGDKGLFRDGGEYYSLHLGLGNRRKSDNLPDKCK